MRTTPNPVETRDAARRRLWRTGSVLGGVVILAAAVMILTKEQDRRIETVVGAVGTTPGNDKSGGDVSEWSRGWDVEVELRETARDLAGTNPTGVQAGSAAPVETVGTAVMAEAPSTTVPEPRGAGNVTGGGSGRFVRNGFWGLDGHRYDSDRYAGVREERDGELTNFERRCATDGGVARFYAVREDGSVHTWELTLASGRGDRDPDSVEYGLQIQTGEAGRALPVPMFSGGSRDGYIHCGFED